jgi:ABC-type sugar transport system permease subunit
MQLTLRRRNALNGYLFIGFWLLGLLVFFLMPLFQNFYLSLTDAQLTTVRDSSYKFIGIQNYVEAFSSDIEFVPYLIQTFTYLLTDVPIILAFSLAVALLATQNVPGGVLFRAIFFLPVVIGSSVVIGRMFDQFGGQLVLFRGQAAQEFLYVYLGDQMPKFITFLSRAVFVLWRSGVQILIFIAGLKSIDPILYEVAQVDGASAWNQFWKITLPMLSPVILINIVYSIIDSFTDYFNMVLRYIRMVTFNLTPNRLGYPSALGNIYFLLIFILVIIIFVVIGRMTFYRGERG